MTIFRLQPRQRGRRLVAACAVVATLGAARLAAAQQRLVAWPDPDTGYCLVPLCVAGPRLVPCTFLDAPPLAIAVAAGDRVTLRYPGTKPVQLRCGF
jgi:hypothetical protein